MQRLAICSILFVALGGIAQQPTPVSEWPLRAVLPVVVMQKSGEPVEGLHAQDFSVAKGVSGAKVTDVKEVKPAEMNGKRPIVIVFDGIANPPQVQKSTRDAILSYLADSVRQQIPVTVIITTANGARVVHSGTSAPVTLAALEKVDKATHALGGKFSSGVSADDQRKSADEIDAEFSRLKDFEQKVETATFYRTFSVQFDTMQMIANALGRLPGRKAVLWITSNFPVKVDEGKKLLALGNTTMATDQVEWWAMTTMYEKSVRMLNAANVSIYGAQPANDNEERTPTNNIPNFYVSPLGLTYVALSDLGNRTGGTIVPFSTDTKKMVDAVEKDLGSYYVLDYQLPAPPQHIDWKELNIKVAKDGVKVRKTDSLFLVADRDFGKK